MKDFYRDLFSSRNTRLIYSSFQQLTENCESSKNLILFPQEKQHFAQLSTKNKYFEWKCSFFPKVAGEGVFLTFKFEWNLRFLEKWFVSRLLLTTTLLVRHFPHLVRKLDHTRSVFGLQSTIFAIPGYFSPVTFKSWDRGAEQGKEGHPDIVCPCGPHLLKCEPAMPVRCSF